MTFADLGAQQVKNIQEPIRAYQVSDVRMNALHAHLADARELPPLPDKPSIAVLPFQNMCGDPEQEYFADGMVEDIITALSRFKSLFVIARNSSFTYKGKSVDIKQVGRELGVRYVLEGSVRKAAARFVSLASSSMPLPEHICGPIGLTDLWMTSSSCRIRSRPA